MTAMARTKLSGFWNRLTTRERFIVLCTLLAALSALFYVYPYGMQERSVLVLQKKVSMTEKEVLDMTAQIADIRSRAADIKSGRTAVRGWDLGDEKGVVLFLEDASNEARRLGVNLVSVHPSQEIDKEQYKEVSLNLDVKARYRDMAEYFRKLETLSRVVNIRKIRLESCPDSSSICAAQVEAVTYLAK